MSDKITKSPQIRFAGFTGAWEQRKLDSEVVRVKSYSLSRDVEMSEYTGYKYIHYGDIHTKVADVINESSKLPNIKAGNYELLDKGDLVIADASEDYQGIATPAVITKDVPYKLVSGLHTIALRPKQVDSLFLYYLIYSPTFRKYGYKTGTGMKVFGISVTNLLKFEGWFPVLEEQTKIGNFFKQLDETISLHQRKLELLKDTKKSLLQKMFPKDGANVPEIRFAGFTDACEQRKLGDMFNILDGDRGKNYPGESDFLKYGATLFLDTGNVKKNGFEFSTRKYITKEKDESLRSGKLELHDFVLTSRGTLGNVAYYDEKTRNNHPSVRINSAMLILRPTMRDEVSDNYMASVLRGNIIDTFMAKNHVGSAQSHITKRDFSNVDIEIPSDIAEQNKIGEFFKTFDHLITLHQRELNSLKNLKKSLLQQMFI